ncbi:MAG: cobalt/nickel transport system ATP-binding protein [Clostridia bacterium]|nr:cobalt/nickel transport system ATP-binding protein [Clostridia bacterium]
MAGHIIKVCNLSYRYADGTQALRGLSFSILSGEKVALMGPNGAGKSTLLLHLNGLYLAQEGEVWVLGRRVSRSNAEEVRKLVGMVFQDPDDQVLAPTVEEDVAFGPRNMGLEPEEVKRRVDKALEDVGLLDLRRKAPHNLSYGQKKRVAIAGVLAMQPEILVLDEPMAFLDPLGQEGLLAILDRYHRAGKTLVIATHDVDFAAAWADRILILSQGSLLASGPAQILCDAGLVQRAGLRLPLVAQLFYGYLPPGSALPHDLTSGRSLLGELLRQG